MKNRFYASRELLPISISLFVLCVGIFFILFAVEGVPEPAYLLVILIILLLALPAILLVAGIIVGCLMIEVTEEGIATVLFGKRRKFFKWEEITEVKSWVQQSARQFVVFCFCNNKKKIKFDFNCRDRTFIITILEKYAPENIVEKLIVKDNQ